MVFVEEASGGHGSRSQMTAIEFILQPFPNEKVAMLAFPHEFATPQLVAVLIICGLALADVHPSRCRSSYLLMMHSSPMLTLR